MTKYISRMLHFFSFKKKTDCQTKISLPIDSITEIQIDSIFKYTLNQFETKLSSVLLIGLFILYCFSIIASGIAYSIYHSSYWLIFLFIFIFSILMLGLFHLLTDYSTYKRTQYFFKLEACLKENNLHTTHDIEHLITYFTARIKDELSTTNYTANLALIMSSLIALYNIFHIQLFIIGFVIVLFVGLILLTKQLFTGKSRHHKNYFLLQTLEHILFTLYAREKNSAK